MPSARSPSSTVVREVVERLLDDREAAEFLGIQPQTLRKLRSKGESPPYLRLGRGPRSHVKYLVSSLLEWIHARTVISTSAENWDGCTPPPVPPQKRLGKAGG